MKEKFRAQKITPKRMEFIELINEILEEYADLGYRLTLRQLYYQMVARGMIDNTVQEYTKLGNTLVMARMNGLTDWEMIEDRIRKPYIPYWVTGIKSAIDDTLEQYRLNRQEGQENYIEVWTEKDAVSNVLRRVTERYHIRLMINRGYSSCSAMKEAYERLAYEHSEQRPIIVYVGDHDPSGLDMLRDIRERLEEFGVEDLQICHAALTWDQIKTLYPPPNPAKITDPRAKWYIGEYGKQSWELDALKPETLFTIVRNAVLEFMDINKWKGKIKQEEEDKKRLREIIKTI